MIDLDSEKETFFVAIATTLLIVTLCICGICVWVRYNKRRERSQVYACKRNNSNKRQGFKQLEMDALEIVEVNGKKHKRNTNINIDSKAQQYNICHDVSDDVSDDNGDIGDDENCDHGTDDVCVPIVNANTMQPQTFGEDSDPETMTIYDYNVTSWSQSDVSKWLKSHLINNQIESNLTDIFIKEFETKYVTGKVLLQLKNNEQLFQRLKKEFSKGNQVFGIWAVFEAALESINQSQ